MVVVQLHGVARSTLSGLRNVQRWGGLVSMVSASIALGDASANAR
jgi:hypothetical protein